MTEEEAFQQRERFHERFRRESRYDTSGCRSWKKGVLIARCFFANHAVRHGCCANKIRFKCRSFTVENGLENHHPILPASESGQRVFKFFTLVVYRRQRGSHAFVSHLHPIPFYPFLLGYISRILF